MNMNMSQRKGKAGKITAIVNTDMGAEVIASSKNDVKGPTNRTAEFSALLNDSPQAVASNNSGGSNSETRSGSSAENSSGSIFSDYQLKQLRAQCLVFLALRFVFIFQICLLFYLNFLYLVLSSMLLIFTLGSKF